MSEKEIVEAKKQETTMMKGKIMERGMSKTFLRMPDMTAATKLSRGTVYNRVRDGLLTKQVKLGGSAVGWPKHEAETVFSAYAAGLPREAVMALVQRLMEARTMDLVSNHLGGVCPQLGGNHVADSRPLINNYNF